MSKYFFSNTPKISKLILGILVLFLLYLSSLYSFTLFHSIVEIFSVIIACGIFMIAWNSRSFSDNNYILFLGISYLLVGMIDLFHMLAYKGMGVFPNYDANLPTQLWILARYIESISLLLSTFYIKKKLNPVFFLFVYMLIGAAFFLIIFYWKVFPNCYVEGTGLTYFKKISEYAICLFLLISVIMFKKNSIHLESLTYTLVTSSIVLTMLAELVFTFYVKVYDIPNSIGHYFKFASFYLIYLAIIQNSLVNPYQLLFRKLKKHEEFLETKNIELRYENAERIVAEDKVSKINLNLLDVQEKLENKVAASEKRRRDAIEKLSRVILSKSDLAQSHAKLITKLKIIEIENQELKKQLTYYFEALEQANEEMNMIIGK